MRRHRTRMCASPIQFDDGCDGALLGMTDCMAMSLVRDNNNYLSCHFGSRFSMKAPMPSSASRAIMFSVITSAA